MSTRSLSKSPRPVHLPPTLAPDGSPDILDLTRAGEFRRLYRAVAESPLDAAPREHLAAWLEVAGEACWASLLRSQGVWRLSNLLDPASPADGRFTADVVFGREWQIEQFGLGLIQGMGSVRVCIDAGLPGWLIGHPTELPRYASAISRLLPVTAVTLTTWPRHFSHGVGPFDQNLFSSVTALSLHVEVNRYGRRSGRITAPALEQIAAIPFLRLLAIPSATVGAEGLRKLAPLVNLTTLDLRDNGLPNESMRFLRHFAKVRFLDLSHNPNLNDAGIQFLRSLTELEWLNLRGTNITTATGQVLSELPLLRTLLVGDSALIRSFHQMLGDRVQVKL